jgi:hypothetical protein
MHLNAMGQQARDDAQKKKKKKGPRSPSKKNGSTPNTDDWEFNLFEMPLLAIPLHFNDHMAVFFVCNPNKEPQGRPMSSTKRIPRPFIVSSDTLHTNTRSKDLPASYEFICWFLSCCYMVTEWVTTNCPKGEEDFDYTQAPQKENMMLFCDAITNKLRNVCEFIPWNAPLERSELVPTEPNKINSGIHACINLAAGIKYGKEFDLRNAVFPGRPLKPNWDNASPSRYITVRRNLHALLMTYKAAGLTKKARPRKGKKKMYSFVRTVNEDENDTKYKQLLGYEILDHIVVQEASSNVGETPTWTDTLCVDFYDDIIEAKSIGYYDKLLRIFYSNLKVVNLSVEEMESAGGCIDAVANIRRKHLLHVRNDKSKDQPNLKCYGIRIADAFQTVYFIRG